MSGPIILSKTGIATAGITGVTFASLLQDTDAGVFIGAFAGAVVYVLSSTELSRFAQVGYFISSFIIGVLGADMTTGIIATIIGKYLPVEIVVTTYIGATVAAAMGVYFLLLLRKISISQLLRRLVLGGGNDNPK